MRVAILDDYFDTLRTLDCSGKLDGHEVTVFTDHVQDVDRLADRLRDSEALVLVRERTEIRAPLLERLPNLNLISQRSVHPHIDVGACTRLGIVVSSDRHAGSPSYATAVTDRPGPDETEGLAGQHEPGGSDRAGRAHCRAAVPPARMAAVDVDEDEPVLDPTHPLLSMDNVVCTPHTGYVTRDEWEVQFADVFDQINAHDAGTPINVVNPDVLSNARTRAVRPQAR